MLPVGPETCLRMSTERCFVMVPASRRLSAIADALRVSPTATTTETTVSAEQAAKVRD